MPTIEVTISQGAIREERLEPLLQDLTRSLIQWEGVADPNDPRATATVLSYIYEALPGRYAGSTQPGASIRALVHITVPQGVLTDERKQGLVDEVTRAVLVAAEEPPHRRVYCLIHEIADGNWGSGGKITRLREMIATLGLDPSSTRYKELVDALR
jgi:4-oxalocrotonate tautomerase family enzyme